MTLKYKRYVVLYGQRGVSKEYKSLNQAKKRAQKKANKMRNAVYIDRLNFYKNGYYSQGRQSTIKPKKKLIKVRRRRSRSRNLWGGGVF